MLIDTNDYIHRVNGIPLYYNGIRTPFLHHPAPPSFYDHYPHTPNSSPPSYDFLMPKIASPVILTPPLSPAPVVDTRRESVIMKVENCQVIAATEKAIENVCRWDNCYRIFESLDKLANHVSLAHSAVAQDNLYYCKWEGCLRTDRGFNARYKMLVHCRTHTKEKPHYCELCTKSFSRAENLKIHIRSHSGEKPYKCPYSGCSKAYSNSSDRFKHTRTHQNNKPYYCKVTGCNKRYTDPSSLRKHVKTFNHETLTQYQKPTEKSDESMDCCESPTISTLDPISHVRTDKIYFEQSDDAIYEKIYYDKSAWIGRDELSGTMKNIRLDEPLDLSIRHNR